MADAWICPRCKRVYSGAMIECSACNRRIAEEEERGSKWPAEVPSPRPGLPQTGGAA